MRGGIVDVAGLGRTKGAGEVEVATRPPRCANARWTRSRAESRWIPSRMPMTANERPSLRSRSASSCVGGSDASATASSPAKRARVAAARTRRRSNSCGLGESHRGSRSLARRRTRPHDAWRATPMSQPIHGVARFGGCPAHSRERRTRAQISDASSSGSAPNRRMRAATLCAAESSARAPASGCRSRSALNSPMDGPPVLRADDVVVE